MKSHKHYVLAAACALALLSDGRPASGLVVPGRAGCDRYVDFCGRLASLKMKDASKGASWMLYSGTILDGCISAKTSTPGAV
jgi:hypothetical protein